MGLFRATGRAGKLSVLAAGKQLWLSELLVTSGSGLAVLDFSPDIRALLLSSVGLLLDSQELLVSLGGETRSLVSPPMLSFLTKEEWLTFKGIAARTLPCSSGQLRHFGVSRGGDGAEPPDGAPDDGYDTVWHAALSSHCSPLSEPLPSSCSAHCFRGARIDVGQEGGCHCRERRKEESERSAAHGAIFRWEPNTDSH